MFQAKMAKMESEESTLERNPAIGWILESTEEI
jgi:hypothetical protein